MSDATRQPTHLRPAGADPSPNGRVDLAALEHLDIAAILATTPPERSWAWDGYIERGTLVVLHGDGGTGKSLLAGHLARAVSAGGRCLGRPTTQGRVVIIDAENKRDIIARRIHALDYATAPTDSIHYYRASDTILGRSGAVDTDRLRTIILTHQPSIVILDSQRGLWAGEEKENLEIRALYRRLQAVAEDLDCAIILIHHDRRAGDFSGGGDIHNSADTRLWLERPDREKPERLLHHAKARDSAELPKASYTFSFDQALGVFTFTAPREPVTDIDTVWAALDVDDWRTVKEVAPRAGMREAEVKIVLWQLVKAGDAQSLTGPPNRSKRAVGFRKVRHERNCSQTREQSGAVAPPVPRRTAPEGGPLRSSATPEQSATPNYSRPSDEWPLYPDDNEVPW